MHSVNQRIAADSSTEEDSDSDSFKSTLKSNVRRDKIIVYWICYREDAQRTLLLTQDQRIYGDIFRSVFHERCDVECFLALSGVGVSVFTSELDSKEHVYVSAGDSPAVWEVNVGHKWKTLTLELASWIEDKYRLPYKKCQLKNYVQVDFEKMYMLKPFFAELRRTYNPALQLHYRRSSSYQFFNLRAQSLQVDNKRTTADDDSIVFCSVPEAEMKATPMVDFSCLKNSFECCDIYKYVRVDVQDVYLNVESDLILSLSRVFLRSKKWVLETSKMYRNDWDLIKAPLIAPCKVRLFSKLSRINLFNETKKHSTITNLTVALN